MLMPRAAWGDCQLESPLAAILFFFFLGGWGGGGGPRGRRCLVPLRFGRHMLLTSLNFINLKGLPEYPGRFSVSSKVTGEVLRLKDGRGRTWKTPTATTTTGALLCNHRLGSN